MMPNFSVRGVLLDIEGTTSAISYVYDVMFPFARRELGAYLDAHWGDAMLTPVAEQVAQDAGQSDLATWAAASASEPKQLVHDEVVRLMDDDVKATGLKQLQGLIWQAGFESGELKAQVFDDVPPALCGWHDAGIDLRIYSSGSIHAQKLFFGHTAAGDLLPLFSGHYDTTTGPKREATSYAKIATDWGLPPSEILFVSDVVEELNAARDSGLQTALAQRPGNADVDDPQDHPAVSDFSQIAIAALQ